MILSRVRTRTPLTFDPVCVTLVGRVFQLNRGSKAYNEGVQVGDGVEEINAKSTAGLMNSEALQLIRSANDRLVLELRRSVSSRL